MTIENFGSLGRVELKLSHQGLVVITGRNEDAGKADSNGAGKSLLLEAFCWCLWGKTIRGLSGDDVVNRLVGKDCRVLVTFTEGEHYYTVERTRKYSVGKPNDLRLYRGPASHEMTAASMSATQDIINQLLGLDFVTFCVMMPGAGVRASEMTDKEVKQLLERLLQTEVLGEAHKRCRDALKQRQQAYTIAEVEKAAVDTALEECEARMGSLKEKWESYEERKLQQIEEMQAEVAALLAQMEDQDRVLARAVGIEEKIEESKSKAASQAISIRTEKNAYNITMRRFDDERAKKRAAEVQAQAEHRKLVRLIKELPDGGDCPTCQQAVSPAYRSKLVDVLEEQRDLIQEHIQDVSSDIENLLQQKVDAEKRQQDTITRLTSVIDLHLGDVKRFEEVKSQAEKAQAVKNQLNAQMKSLSARQWTLQKEENPFQGLIAQTAEEAFVKAAMGARHLKDMKSLEHEIALYEYWLTGFSPQGVRSFLLEHVTPILNEAAKKYADLLTDGEMSVTFHTQQKLRSGKMVEKFNIVVTNAHGGQSYSACSAGERSRANLCVAFALGDLAAMRASKSVSFRFLDEPFENVDESGTDAIMTLLNDQKDRFDSVFVITHQDHFKQLFPKKISVVKKNGISSLEEQHG